MKTKELRIIVLCVANVFINSQSDFLIILDLTIKVHAKYHKKQTAKYFSVTLKVSDIHINETSELAIIKNVTTYLPFSEVK